MEETKFGSALRVVIKDGWGERLNIRLLLHTHSHRGNSESNEINHSLGVSACFLCTSFLRQPTAKLDYVFLLINCIFFCFVFYLILICISTWKNNTTTKKKEGKIYKAEKKNFRFPFTTTTIFIWPRPFSRQFFHVLYLALLPFNTCSR